MTHWPWSQGPIHSTTPRSHSWSNPCLTNLYTPLQTTPYWFVYNDKSLVSHKCIVNTDPRIEYSVRNGIELTFQFVTKDFHFWPEFEYKAFCEEFTLCGALLNFYYLFNNAQVKKEVQLQTVYRILIRMWFNMVRIHNTATPEAEFLDANGTNILRVFLHAIHSRLVLTGF
jgi:hypothetical protein